MAAGWRCCAWTTTCSRRAAARTTTRKGIINLPLTAREIQAVVFFRTAADGEVRVSMRSKYDVDVRMVANEHGGGGHKNAAGFTVTGALHELQPRIVERLVRAVDEGLESRPPE